MSDIRRAAQRWADTWRRAWERHDVEAIVALYAPTAVYSTQPFREAYRGRRGAREYVSQAFAAEEHVEAWFGRPIVAGDRASVAWWACTVEQGRAVTLAGTSTLRFDEDGLVLEEWDTWNQVEGGIPPDPDWGP
jgi:ketosteroid isomerase-like protein